MVTIQEKIFYYTHPGIYQKKLQELTTTEEKVAVLLKQHEALRNSDKLLTFYYWILVDGYKGELDNKAILSLTPAESIRRVRQFIQSPEGLNMFLPTDPEVIQARNITKNAVGDWVRIMKNSEAFFEQNPLNNSRYLTASLTTTIQ